jgi:hypothetical protein
MANIKISDLTSAASVSGTQQFEVNESGTSKKVTGAQIATYVEGEISSSPTFTGQVSNAAGSSAAPSITVTGDTNTGIYFPAADTVSISTGGTLRVSVDSSGSLVTAGAIELGHASDTTLSRVSAGVIAVEGITVPLNSVTNTHTAQQIELGHASDTTISRVSAGVIAVEGQTLATQTYVTNSLSSTIPSGTRMLFQQTAAPTGWTKDTTQNDKALRVVSGSVSSGGTVDFSTAFANKSFSGSTSSQGVTGTVGDTTLSTSQIPSHTHYVASPGPTDSAALSNANYVDVSFTGYTTGNNNYVLRGTSVAPSLGVASYNGGGGSHTHTFSGGSHSHTFSGAIDMAVKYIDLIIAQKD